MFAADRPDFCSFPYACPIAGRITPQVGQRGTEVTVLVRGGRLEQIQDLLFYGIGIKYVGYRLVDEAMNDITQQSVPVKRGTVAELTLSIAKDCPLGRQYFRIRTADALSEMLSFWVTPFPCVNEAHKGHDSPKNTNGTFETVQPVKLGTTLLGFHPSYTTIDYDFYSVKLRKGQRLTVEIWSACLGYEHFRGITDTAITVFNPSRKKVAFSDDTSLRDMDPIVSFIAAESGTYFVNIHQNMDFEGSLRPYAAHFSDAPRPSLTYPLGGQAGTTIQTTLIGNALEKHVTGIDLPSKAGSFHKSIIDVYTSNAVLPNRLQVAAFPNVLEDGKDHFRPEDAQVVRQSLPLALNGRIQNEGKTDWFQISAKKGARYRIRTYAATLGSSLDARIQVRPVASTKSRININADDSTWVDHDWWGKDKVWFIKDRMDPVAVFEPDADGEYLIGISDSQRLFGDDYAYRIELQPLKDHAFIYFGQDYREAPNKRDRLVIPRGNTIEHTFSILYATGNKYRGGMRIVADGLPAGITFDCPPLKPGQMRTQATLTAEADAELWTGLVDLRLEATEPDTEFSGSYVQNIPSTQRRGGYNVVFNCTRKCAMAVVDPAPLKVRVKQPKIGLAQNAIIDLQVDIERSNGFTGPVRVYASWTPPGVTVPVPLIIPKDQTQGTYRLRASSNVDADRYPITLTAQEEEGGDRAWGTGFHFVASPPISLNVVRPYLEIQLARTAIERQKSGVLNAQIKIIKPLPSNAVATLVRLPKGVELIRSVTIKPGDKTVSFPVRVTRDCLIGQYQEIGCEITIQEQGQKITQQTGNGTLRVDAERGTQK